MDEWIGGFFYENVYGDADECAAYFDGSERIFIRVFLIAKYALDIGSSARNLFVLHDGELPTT